MQEFQELYEKYSRYVYHFLLKLTNSNADLADELTQAVSYTHLDVYKRQGQLVDYIVDSAGQKGTGRWTSLESLKQGVNVSMITAACNARIMSNRLEQRAEAKKVIPGPQITEAVPKTDSRKEAFANLVREGLYAAKIVAYAQGFDLLFHASAEYGWNLDFGRIAAIFRAGCIIPVSYTHLDVYKRQG